MKRKKYKTPYKNKAKKKESYKIIKTLKEDVKVNKGKRFIKKKER